MLCCSPRLSHTSAAKPAKRTADVAIQTKLALRTLGVVLQNQVTPTQFTLPGAGGVGGATGVCESGAATLLGCTTVQVCVLPSPYITVKKVATGYLRSNKWGGSELRILLKARTAAAQRCACADWLVT
jgi:hypothetical protein